jgi:hypothetical protein
MTAGRNYWYLDIKELDTQNEFSVGPFGGSRQEVDSLRVGIANRAYPAGFQVDWENLTQTGATYSPVDLVQQIQAAFDEALEDGRTPNTYQIRVKAVKTKDTVLDDNTDRGNRRIVLKYEILKLPFTAADPGFDILFGSGDHGVTQRGTDIDIASPGQTQWPIAEFSVINESAPVVLSVPYCNQTVMIMDRPPVPPDVVFVPYVGVNNKIMVLFGSNMGEFMARPVILKNSDASFIADEYYAQKGITVTEEQVLTPDVGELTRPKLEYRNDDPVRKYELFRIDQKPTSYDDFRGKNLTAGPIQAELGPGKFSTAPAFVDNIQPNRKYWYCARSIDIHENISNPTYIFEIEMVDNKGQMYMRHKVVNFEPQVLNYKKMGRKILAIEPRNVQRYYNAANPPGDVALNQIPTSNILGTSEVNNVSSIWNKKFKVRITSKKTGRKIDLNLTFKNTGVVIP